MGFSRYWQLSLYGIIPIQILRRGKNHAEFERCAGWGRRLVLTAITIREGDARDERRSSKGRDDRLRLVVLASKLTRGAHLRTAFGQNRYRAEGLKQFGAVSGAVRLFREDHD